MSYEILQDEKEYNVIIGYKDDMAITLNGIELMDGGKKALSLKITSIFYRILRIRCRL